MRYVLGIDGGGTTTKCLIADDKGNLIGQGKSVYYIKYLNVD